MRYVSQPVKKLDGMPIVKGKPLYTNDLAPNECLIVLALRSLMLTQGSNPSIQAKQCWLKVLNVF